MERKALRFTLLPERFAICRKPSQAPMPEWVSASPFAAVTRTPEELSVVCPQEAVPPGVEAAREYRCLKIQGPLPLTETGVLLAFLAPLAELAIPVFALSTYDTDYVLIPEARCVDALAALQRAGHEYLASG